MDIKKPYFVKIHCVEKERICVNFKTEEESVDFLYLIHEKFKTYDTFHSYSEQILIQKQNFILAFCGKEHDE